jgi:hypothetical protein
VVDLLFGELRRGLMGPTVATVGKHKRKMPPWLVGLLIAIVFFAVALIAIDLLGFGDDPVVGSLGPLSG